MRYVRFVLATRHPDSGIHEGLFRTAYELKRRPSLNSISRRRLEDALDWLDEHLDLPSRFNRTTSKGWYRRNSRGISWFRDSAQACIARMHVVKQVLESCGYRVSVITESRIGYIVYEDDHQVVAEPFHETRTSA